MVTQFHSEERINLSIETQTTPAQTTCGRSEYRKQSYCSSPSIWQNTLLPFQSSHVTIGTHCNLLESTLTETLQATHLIIRRWSLASSANEIKATKSNSVFSVMTSWQDRLNIFQFYCKIGVDLN